jgi:hypothetical protein
LINDFVNQDGKIVTTQINLQNFCLIGVPSPNFFE